jgi:hypothetical protein
MRKPPRPGAVFFWLRHPYDRKRRDAAALRRSWSHMVWHHLLFCKIAPLYGFAPIELSIERFTPAVNRTGLYGILKINRQPSFCWVKVELAPITSYQVLPGLYG